MRRRSSSFVGVRRYRVLILTLPVIFVVAFFQAELGGIFGINLFPSLARNVQPARHGLNPAGQTPPYRIDKLSMLFDPNELYERALDTQRKHNRKHGYSLRMLPQPVTNGYWNKLLFILTQVTQELAKPADERVEWFIWLDAHVVNLNPSIPLQALLPSRNRDFRETHFIGTRKNGEFNPSSFFIHVHPWSIKLLVKAMAVPMIDEEAELGTAMDQRSLSYILNETEFRSAVMYQPHTWYDGEHIEGGMMAQFPADLKGARWKRLSDCLDQLDLESLQHVKRPTFLKSFYPKEIDDYWERARNLNFMILVAKELQKALDQWNQELAFHTQRLQDILDYEVDQRNTALEAIEAAKTLVKELKHRP